MVAAYSRPSSESAVISPSRRAVVTASATVMTTPLHVTIHADITAVTTNTDTGTVRRSTRLDAAARALTTPTRWSTV